MSPPSPPAPPHADRATARWPGRAAAALLAGAVALALGAVPAAAQEPAPGGTSTTSTTGTSSTGATSATAPGAAPATPPPPPVPDPVGDADAPPETVPQVDVTIPPREVQPTGPYAGQPPVEEHPGRVVRVTARGATERAAETLAAVEEAIARRDLLLQRQAQLRAATQRLRAEERRAIAALEQAQVELESRAAEAYIRGNGGAGQALILADDPSSYAQRVEVLRVVLEEDEAAVRRYRRARAEADTEQARTARELASVTRALAEAERDVQEATIAHDVASRELAITMAGGELVIHGFVFPVAQPYQFGDTFGAPRMTGTQYEHWHEGTDIFAPMGTELLAAERGVVTRVRTGGTLGGNTVWLQGESGTAYYYAHLFAFAPGVREGLLVEAGTVLGYVGDTGNARGTPPHLHFEVHPNGGDAINPAPILVVAASQPQPEPIRLPPPAAPPAPGPVR